VNDRQAIEGMSAGKRGKSAIMRLIHKFDFYWKLFIAVIPAGVIGLLLGDYIDVLLGSVTVVAVMLVLGGVFMLYVDNWFNKPSQDQSMTWQRALKIGICQCIAMIPGVSRSMATIVGGMGTKLTRKNAAEFSFFLAVPTMAAAAGYKLYQLLKDPVSSEMLSDNLFYTHRQCSCIHRCCFAIRFLSIFSPDMVSGHSGYIVSSSAVFCSCSYCLVRA